MSLSDLTPRETRIWQSRKYNPSHWLPASEEELHRITIKACRPRAVTLYDNQPWPWEKEPETSTLSAYPLPIR